MPVTGSCYVVQIETPKKILLNGLWLGSKRSKRIIIWVHGLAGSMFGKLSIAEALVGPATAVLVFNNRGHDNISQLAGRRRRQPKLAGGGAEIFTQCVDDIEGAIDFAKTVGVSEVYLTGYSTGAQKSIYWASKTTVTGAVRGIILLGPMSDYSTLGKFYSKSRVAAAKKLAKSLVKKSKPNYILPQSTWSPPITAQRFLSLYSGLSTEEIFTYWSPERIPRTLAAVEIPVLVLLAEKDEFADRSANKISAWFDKNISSPHRVVIIPKVRHDFVGGEKAVACQIRKFMRTC